MLEPSLINNDTRIKNNSEGRGDSSALLVKFTLVESETSVNVELRRGTTNIVWIQVDSGSQMVSSRYNFLRVL